MSRKLSLTLRIWRQESTNRSGVFHVYRLEHISADLSLLEALDRLNEPVSYTHLTLPTKA